MDQNRPDSMEKFLGRLAEHARMETPPQVDVAARVLAAARARRRMAGSPVWDWSFGAVALASCAVALVTVAASADAFGFLFDPLVALFAVYPSIQF